MASKSRSVTADTWILEIASCIASLLCMVIVIILLARFDGQPIFTWYGISLNTLISVGSTLAKTFLLFSVSACLSQWKFIAFSLGHRRLRDFDILDASSRGPQGSFELLWYSRFGTLAALGAIVTILTLASDPFTQQVVGLAQRQSDATNPGNWISFARRYDQGSSSGVTATKFPGTDLNGAVNNMDFSMRSAVMSGLAGIPQQPRSVCTSGTCEYADYRALAVCSSCTDLSSSLQKTAKNYTFHELQYIVYDSRNPSGAQQAGLIESYKLSNGLELFNDTIYSSSGLALITFASSNRSNSVAYKDVATMFWSVSGISRPEFNGSSKPYNAFECALYYCVNNYTSIYQNGTVNQTFNTTNLKRNTASLQPLSSLSNKNDTPPANQLDISYVLARSDLEIGQGYNVSDLAINGIGAGLSNMFTLSSPAVTNMNKINGVYLKTAAGGSNDQPKPDVMQVLYKAYNGTGNISAITTVFNNIATSMTNTMGNADNGTQLVYGTGSIVVYRVRWPWLALPLLTVLGSIVFLAICMQETRARQLQVWKSSSLAVLKCGTNTEELLKNEDKVGAMEKVAKIHFMSFRNGGNAGNELVRDDESTANLAANAEVFSVDSFKGSSRSLRGGGYSTVELDELNSYGR